MSRAVDTPAIGEYVDQLFGRLKDRGTQQTLVHRGASVGAEALLINVEEWISKLRQYNIGPGVVCAYIGDYGEGTVSLTLALMRLGAIAMPLTEAALPQLRDFIAIGGTRLLVRFDYTMSSAGAQIEDLGSLPQNDLVKQFQATNHPGLVVFTSGSTGGPKGVLHDCERVLSKFATTRRGWRTILFLGIDHFGGFNTLMSCLSYGGVGISIPERLPESVCQAINGAKADLLPTTPTFLNMLLASGSLEKWDLSSLQLITYGAEPMPQTTLQRISIAFPNVEFKQTYGLSELGVLHSRSAEKESLWLRVGGDGFETRVVDGVLFIRSRSNMVGYLNAPSPIDSDGWMNTGDLVEEKDGFYRFLGRKTEIINVGGQKVFPAEVENVLLEAPGVSEATVYARPHLLLGQAVVARVSVTGRESPDEVAARLKAFCRTRLSKFKIPMSYEFVESQKHSNERSKKSRPR